MGVSLKPLLVEKKGKGGGMRERFFIHDEREVLYSRCKLLWYEQVEWVHWSERQIQL